MIKFKLNYVDFTEFKRLCDLPAKVNLKLQKFLNEPSIFDSFDLEYEDYVGISDQITAIKRGYDAI